MPKGVYDRDSADIRGVWSEEQDAWLQQACTRATSWNDLAREFAIAFPNDRKSRNALLGRATRKGWTANKPQGKSNGTQRSGRVDATGVPAAGSKPLSAYGKRVTKQKVKALGASVLREDRNTRLKEGTFPGQVRKTPEQIAEARKGHIPNVVEEKPQTSRPMFETEADCCKWPTSTDVRCMEVCGQPATVGAYCERHALVAYRAMPTRKRNGSFSRRGYLEERKRIDDADAKWIADNVLDDEVQVIAEDEVLMIPHFIGSLD